MATKIYCDYCGEQIEGNYAGIEAGGILHRKPLRQVVSEQRFLYHSESAAYGEASCFESAMRSLEDMATSAHGGADSGLEWRLMPAARRTEDDGHTPINDEWRERVDAGTPLYQLDLCSKASEGLREANLVTLEEVAGRSADEIRSVDGIGPKSYRRLADELERLGLTFGSEETA